jgi:hypothetical protein
VEVGILRLIARFPDLRQAASLVDTLKNAGFDRKDMIISDLAKEQKYNSVEEAAEEITFRKTERDGLGEIETFGSGIKGLEGREGIIVALETPKHESDRVRSMMDQSGAVEIVQD